jgi:5'-nucleotidase
MRLITVLPFKAAFVFASLLSACGGSDDPRPVPAAPLPDVSVQLIGLNDFHGNLEAPGGSVNVTDAASASGTRVSAGGAAYLATLIKTLKAKNANTLVVAAGDMIGASPLTSAAFHDEPTVDALSQLGLDVTSVGNHEFDKGRDELLRMQNGGCFPVSADGKKGIVGTDTCMTAGKFAGAKFQYLAANVIDTTTNKPLFPSYIVKDVGGVKIGFIGLTLKDTPTVVTPAGVAGLSFTEEVATVNALIPEIKAKGTSAIVVLIHQGGGTTSTAVNDKACPGFNGPILDLADKFDKEVNVVVSGHSHQEYICNRPDGKLVTQTGFYGRVATSINLVIDPNTKTVKSKQADNIVNVNDLVIKTSAGVVIPLPAGVTPYAKDAALDALVTNYVALTAPIKNAVSGSITATIDRTQTTAGESAMGDVVADAYLNATATAAFGTPVIAMTNSGGLRQNLTYDAATMGQTTFGQLYAVLPFGNNMVTMDLTGDQIRRLLEQQWEAPQPAGGRILQVSAGFTYTWDSTKPEGAAAGTGSRIVAGSIALNGVALDLAKTYRVTVNNFMATGGDNFKVLVEGKNRQDGPIDIDLFDAYFKAKSPVAPGLKNRITRL